jgi:hypothetical protein
MKAKNSASSSDEIALFQAYIDLINSELDTIWARHNALLVANSLIIGALAISPTALWENKWAALAMLSAGLLHQRPMGRDHDAGMVGDATACWSCWDLCLPASRIFPIHSARPSATARRPRIYYLILLVIPGSSSCISDRAISISR